MSDRIRDTPEVLERYEGEALALREHQLQQNFASPLGPLDFCVVRKAFDQIYLPEVIRSAPLRTCAYHSVTGLDTSSTAGVAAYFSELVNQQEPQGWLSTGVWRIEGGIFCAYDCFSKSEVRMDISIPGTVNCYVISPSGSHERITPAIWKGLWVSSVLRAFAFVRSNRVRSIHWQTVRVLDTFQNRVEENEFLDAARDFFVDGSSLGSDDVVLPADSVNNRLVSSIMEYFFDMHRYPQAISFFSSLIPQESLMIIPVALSHSKLGETSYALSVLSEAARKEADYVPLLLTQSELLLASGQVSFARRVAQRVVELEPLLSKGWLLLARAYVADERLADALVCLNMALYEKSSAMFEAKRHESFGCGRSAERSAENAAFDVLVDIANHTGWQGLLDLRSDVFLMEPETAFSEELGSVYEEQRLDTTMDGKDIAPTLASAAAAGDGQFAHAECTDGRTGVPFFAVESDVRDSVEAERMGDYTASHVESVDSGVRAPSAPDDGVGAASSDTDDRGAENGSGYEQDTENPSDGKARVGSDRVVRSRTDPALRSTARAGVQSRGRESGYESSDEEMEPFRIVRIPKKKQRSPTIRATGTASGSASAPRPGRVRSTWTGGMEGPRETEIGDMALPETGGARAAACTPVATELRKPFPALYSPLLRSPPPSSIPQASVADRVGSTPRTAGEFSDDCEQLAQPETSTALPGTGEKKTAPSKRLCGVGLDGIFLSLFHDLRDFSLWVDDQRRQFPAHQLLRFGALAERLKAYKEALFAYCECVRQIREQIEVGGRARSDSGLIAAYEGWLRVCVETKELRDSLIVLDSLVRLLFPPGSAPTRAEIAFSVTSAICSLLEAFGSAGLLAQQARIGPPHPVVHSFLKACGVWEVVGYDK